MHGAIRLTLMIGPGIPVPVPSAVLDALQKVSVTLNSRTMSVFELTFSLSTRSPLHTLFLLAGGSAIPIVRVIIVVTVNGTSTVLMDGVMTEVSVVPGSDSAHATLNVKGDDLTRLMDYVDTSGLPLPNMPVEARVALTLAKYAALGVIPMVIPRYLFEVPVMTDQIPSVQGSDLHFVCKLAEEAGYVFYLKPGPAPRTSVAYWGPEIRIGQPQPALRTNQDAHTNVEALSFNFSGDTYKLPVLLVQNKKSKIPIPIPVPDVSPIKPPLAKIPVGPKGIDFINVAKFSEVRATLKGIAQSGQTSDNVTGTGTLDVLRYGRVLHPRKLVGVSGAGMAYDGLYYVDAVTHALERGAYKQQFTLKRNGLVSIVDRVVP
jgi:hypothetical protein